MRMRAFTCPPCAPPVVVRALLFLDTSVFLAQVVASLQPNAVRP